MVHPDGRVETYIVGLNVVGGERVQWIVEGGVWKASYLLGDGDGDGDGIDEERGNGGEKVNGGHGQNGVERTKETPPGSGGLLISETVVPGFEYCDHEFLRLAQLRELVGEEKSNELAWLCRSIDGER